MNAADAALKFPVICLTTQGDLLGARDFDTLTSCTKFALTSDLQTGMEMVDAGLRSFKVRSFRRTGYSRPFPAWLLKGLISGVEHRIEHDLEPMPAITLNDLKNRLAALIEAEPETWAETDDVAQDTERLLSRIASAKTAEELYELTVVDDLNAY